MQFCAVYYCTVDARDMIMIYTIPYILHPLYPAGVRMQQAELE